MIGKKMQDAMNEQVKNEFYSANLYLAMSIHFDREGLTVFADWFEKQAKEEETHAMKFIKYVTGTGGKALV
ncbi:MAG: ferritin, partial [Candidatus Altiarchaeota archaeon]|nr:ferritin [Candidatus Altiarchaeota archaeon]